MVYADTTWPLLGGTAMLRIFADLGFRWKMALPILLLATLLVAMGFLGMRGIDQVADSSTRLTNRFLPGISLLLNADRDLYQAFVAERSMLGEGASLHASALAAAHAENMQQAYDRVHKFAAMQPGAEAMQLVAQFDSGFARWKATSQQVLQLAGSDQQAASALSFAASEEQFEAMRTAIDKLGEMDDQAANDEGMAAIRLGETLSWQQGLIWFVAHDPRVPAKVRDDMKRFGLPRDEFTDNGGWPRAFYVRNGRRLVGDFVLTEAHLRKNNPVPVVDSVGLIWWPPDFHHARCIVKDGRVWMEGAVFDNSPNPNWIPCGIPYRALVPKIKECTNLLTPTCPSSSYVAYGAYRIEFTFMTAGQSCATAACLAVDSNAPVQRRIISVLGSIWPTASLSPRCGAWKRRWRISSTSCAPPASARSSRWSSANW